MGSEAIIVFFIAGVVMVAGANFLSNLISHKSDNPQKREPYESGMTTIGPTWVQFKVGYYLFAILFLIFDVEVAFLFPWATVYGKVTHAVSMLDPDYGSQMPATAVGLFRTERFKPALGGRGRYSITP